MLKQMIVIMRQSRRIQSFLAKLCDASASLDTSLTLSMTVRILHEMLRRSEAQLKRVQHDDNIFYVILRRVVAVKISCYSRNVEEYLFNAG